MFAGTIPPALRSIVSEAVSGWAASDVYVGCSGNFTIERLLDKRGLRLHGNDVQLYSSAIGGYLAGEPLAVSVRAEYAERFGWLAPYLVEPDATVATVMLSTRMLVGVDRQNAYYARMRAAYRAQWPALHAKTVERVRSVSLRLASYLNGDVMDFVDQCPKEGAFVSFPPFWAGGYETMFADLDTVFTWPRPTYREFDPQTTLQELIEQATDRRHWMLGTMEPQPSLAGHLHGLVQTTLRGVPIYVYSSSGTPRLVVPRQSTEPVLIPRLGQSEALAGEPHLILLRQPQFNALRSQYLNPRIAVGSANLPLGLMVGDRLIGVIGLAIGGTTPHPPTHGLDQPYVYLLADFPVAPTAYPRLSSLVVMAALSTEVRRMAERVSNGRVRSLITTAFTDRPVSMKYRGLLTLLKRAPQEDGRFALNYGAPAGRWTLAEAYDQWRSKHLPA